MGICEQFVEKFQAAVRDGNVEEAFKDYDIPKVYNVTNCKKPF